METGSKRLSQPAWGMGPEKLLREGTWSLKIVKGIPSKDTVYTKTQERGRQVLSGIARVYESSQRYFHSTSGIEGTFLTLMEFRDWWGEKDKEISDYHVIIVMMRVLM